VRRHLAVVPPPGASPDRTLAEPGHPGERTARVTSSAGGATVDVAGLDVGYAGPRGVRPVLAGLDLRLEPGYCLAIVGESGCGKSTLLHVLAGLLAPLRGAVDVDGAQVAAPGVAVPGHAAYLFQQDLLLPWRSVLGNTVFAARVARPSVAASAELEARARALLEEFGLGDRLDAMPGELSGGMRQRVALARTLVLGRGLVLLDEPFANLDALTRGDMQRWMLRVMRTHPASWVLVTHDVAEAVLLGDTVAVLSGRPATLTGRIDVAVHDHARAAAEVHRLLRDGREA
jgi:ABC-type nitrate/sulfonate/bicarbonate transport system ATPase subunit